MSFPGVVSANEEFHSADPRWKAALEAHRIRAAHRAPARPAAWRTVVRVADARR